MGGEPARQAGKTEGGATLRHDGQMLLIDVPYGKASPLWPNFARNVPPLRVWCSCWKAIALHSSERRETGTKHVRRKAQIIRIPDSTGFVKICVLRPFVYLHCSQNQVWKIKIGKS